MGLKIWLALASTLMVLDIAYGAASTLTCPAVIVGADLVCTCAMAAGDTPTAADVVWNVAGSATTAGISGDRKKIWTKSPSTAADNGVAVKCTMAGSAVSAPFTTVVENALAPTITCTPPPKVGVESTCTCAKPAAQTLTPTNCKLKIGTAADGTAAACDALKVTPAAADKDKKIFCKTVFGSTVSDASAAGVDIAAPAAQAKPTIEGAKTDADEEVTLTCKAEKADESGIKYKWYKAGTVVTGQEASTTKVKCDGGKEFKYTCKVTNAGGDSPASAEATVKFKATCKSTNGNAAAGIRPSLMILGSILLLTTILLKQ